MSATTRKLLKWELRWIPVEVVMTGFGLFLLLRLQLPDAGTYFLFLAVALSCVVRMTHYCSTGHRHTNNTPLASGAANSGVTLAATPPFASANFRGR